MNAKRERFVRIAEARTQKILEMLRLLGNCSVRANYDYTDKDVKMIFTTLEQELKNTKSKFRDGIGKEKRFSLE